MDKPAIEQRINEAFEKLGQTADGAGDKEWYYVCATVLREIMSENRRKWNANLYSKGTKRVHYLSMEFLPGQSFKNTLGNLGLTEIFEAILKEHQVNLMALYDFEPDAGLGNGGLGRLAACYLDGAATDAICMTGYSILYEYGIFKQKITDGWQEELPDCWLGEGQVWLESRPEQAVEVRFGGRIEEGWESGRHWTRHVDYTTVTAVPHDMFIAGYGSKGTSVLRLYQAQSPGVDMEKFNEGDYIGAFGATSVAETISKVLYPNDSHFEGKKLRLRQQYFLSSAAVSDIIHRHLQQYGTLDNLSQKNAIQINDTHPVLAIPELMRVLLDECGYDWDAAYDMVCKTFSYTNHTVMSEALEVWNEELVATLLPRVYQIIVEINRRFCAQLHQRGTDSLAVGRMAIISYGTIRMANLAAAVAHTINGVSKLHSKIITTDVFPDYYAVAPQKFTNVTNGIAQRRWLMGSNPSLTRLLEETIGDGFKRDLSLLGKFKEWADDGEVLQRILQSKRENKVNLTKRLLALQGETLNPDFVFDMQLKRLHEYKRQQLNALNIIARCQQIKENPDLEVLPRVYFFAAKAAPGYFIAKQIIKLACTLEQFTKQEGIRDKIRVCYVEDYKVSLSEILMPAADFSQQISLAGTEASGTGNMKFMLNGAITVGTLDGANVEICEAAGMENEIIFGLRANEVKDVKDRGYYPKEIAQADPILSKALEALVSGELGATFPELYNTLLNEDRYLTLADFASYRLAMQESDRLYANPLEFAKKSLINTASSSIFSADRAVKSYGENIWGIF